MVDFTPQAISDVSDPKKIRVALFINNQLVHAPLPALVKDRAKVVDVPASAASDGTAGSIAYDDSYFYVCVADGTWKRVALSSF